jgi:hypothetical protein
VRSAISDNNGPLPADLRQQIRLPLLAVSWRLRALLLSGLVVDMSVKPERAVSLMTIAALIGVAWSIPLWRRS